MRGDFCACTASGLLQDGQDVGGFVGGREDFAVLFDFGGQTLGFKPAHGGIDIKRFEGRGKKTACLGREGGRNGANALTDGGRDGRVDRT